MKKFISVQAQFRTAILFVIVALILSNSFTFAQFKAHKEKTISFLGLEEKSLNYYPTIHYNRVEGLYLGMGMKYGPSFLPAITLLGEGGYGISNEEWRYRAGILKDFFEFNKLKICAEAFYLTASLDDWYIGSSENSFAALFLKEDFMNYFGKQGFKVFVNQILLDNQVQLRIEASNYDYFAMTRCTNWAIFGKNKNFKQNPAVFEGNETSLKLIASYDGRDNPLFPISGWTIDAIYEHTTGDSTTNGLFLTLKYFQSIYSLQRFRTKVMFGSRVGSMAEQHTMDLGGLGTLPGFKDKEFQNGNRFLLFNFQYLFGGELLSKLPLSFIPLYDALTLSVFADIGWLNWEKEENFSSFFGFDKIETNKLKTDVGLALSISEDMFLIKFAKRTDRSDDAWRIIGRLIYKF